MSRIHVLFIKESEDGDNVSYRVDSSDFNTSRIQEPIARITINRVAKNFGFEPLGELAGEQVVPPYVYELPANERERILRTQYDGFGYGGWTSRIAKMVRQLIASDNYPNEIRGVT